MGTTPLRAHPDVFNVPPSGFIVDLKVNRRRRRVVVSHDGQVVGVTTDKRYDYPDLVALQEERKYALLDRPAKAGNRKARGGKPS